jgi:hypothetical protein
VVDPGNGTSRSRKVAKATTFDKTMQRIPLSGTPSEILP